MAGFETLLPARLTEVVPTRVMPDFMGINNEELFNVEYADVLGFPFNFTAKPVIAPPQPPRETIQVKAVRLERDHLEIIFPNVAGYRVELPQGHLSTTAQRCAAIAQTLLCSLMAAVAKIICSILL
ncbi:MAG: hypothetical protein WCI64_11035 [Chlorobium sp.]